MDIAQENKDKKTQSDEEQKRIAKEIDDAAKMAKIAADETKALDDQIKNAKTQSDQIILQVENSIKGLQNSIKDIQTDIAANKKIGDDIGTALQKALKKNQARINKIQSDSVIALKEFENQLKHEKDRMDTLQKANKKLKKRLKKNIDFKTLAISDQSDTDIKAAKLVNDMERNLKAIDDNFNLGYEELIDIMDKQDNPEYTKLSDKEIYINNYIDTCCLKENLYKFIEQCDLLESIPTWRIKLARLIYGYLEKYELNPNDKKTPSTLIPSYEYFNIVLMGTPGVGKSYTSGKVGLALKWSGLLTIGDMKDIKKPDLIGSYVGQTTPKVYKELVQGLGKVVFIDEAYSIAGPKDNNTGKYNEYGQEALDAITDYTSEHIGLFAFVVAGYEYEMRNQFLSVNIGLPRRFPTVLTLNRYNLLNLGH